MLTCFDSDDSWPVGNLDDVDDDALRKGGGSGFLTNLCGTPVYVGLEPTALCGVGCRLEPNAATCPVRLHLVSVSIYN